MSARPDLARLSLNQITIELATHPCTVDMRIEMPDVDPQAILIV